LLNSLFSVKGPLNCGILWSYLKIQQARSQREELGYLPPFHPKILKFAMVLDLKKPEKMKGV